MPHLRVLITVKTYPVVSERYDELVCTAGVCPGTSCDEGQVCVIMKPGWVNNLVGRLGKPRVARRGDFYRERAIKRSWLSAEHTYDRPSSLAEVTLPESGSNVSTSEASTVLQDCDEGLGEVGS